MSYNNFKPNPKPEKVEKKKKKYIYKKEPTGEKIIFEEIWAERPHQCQICLQPISAPSACNFMHVLPKAKNKYPLLKLEKNNILIACGDGCHFIWDFKRHTISAEDYNWKWVFELEKKLKDEYHGRKG